MRAALLAVLLPWLLAAQAPPEPAANLPVQRIGANDLLHVSVYGAPEFSRTVRVGADGFMRLPMLPERLRAEGLMPADLENALAQALQAAGLLVEPSVTVTVAEYHSRPISVAGAVKNPLTFQATGPVTLLEALTRAGGLAPEAGPEILISRSQAGPDGQPLALVRRVAVRALIDQADPQANPKLGGGEEIRVPEVGKIFVVGSVKKPGAYAVLDNGESSALKMLALAEGLTPYASKQAYIYRREASGSKHEIPIPLNHILQRKAADVPLLANDVLYIPDNSGRRTGFAALERILMFGSGAATSLIYAAAIR